jgi:organic radical activating enzyme
MITVASINFHDSLNVIRSQLENCRKDIFEHNERIVFTQSHEDNYPFVDAPGQRLIEIQQLVDQIDISNNFILIRTANPDILAELNDVVSNYSYQSHPFEYELISGEYKRHDTQYLNTLCAKLWEHLYVGPDGNTNPCCVSDKRFPTGNINSININAGIIKQHMVNGYRVRACKKCYENEDSGIKSARQPCNYTLGDQNNIVNIDIRINNLCNFKCRMCSEEYSSSIQAETVKLYGKNATLGYQQFKLTRDTLEQRQTNFNKIKPYINKNLKSIYFAGGEPLLVEEHYQILDHLLSIGHTTVSIKYNTNLSQLDYKSKSVVDYWNQFEDVTVGASIDASGAVAEYIRHGTVWNNIERNISKIKNESPATKLTITSTVGFLNIENLIELQQYYLNNKIFNVDDFSLSVLTHPIFLSVSVLPEHHKNRLGSKIENQINFLGNSKLANQWNTVLYYMNNNDHSYTLPEFKKRMQTLDKHRGESFIEVFPQFADLYD